MCQVQRAALILSDLCLNSVCTFMLWEKCTIYFMSRVFVVVVWFLFVCLFVFLWLIAAVFLIQACLLAFSLSSPTYPHLQGVDLWVPSPPHHGNWAKPWQFINFIKAEWGFEQLDLVRGVPVYSGGFGTRWS